MRHSIVLSGILVGVDFTQAGEFTNDSGEVIKYGDSVKLKMNIPHNVTKHGIETQITDQYTLQIPVVATIQQDVQEYNKLLGKTFEAPITMKSDLTFKTQKPKMVA